MTLFLRKLGLGRREMRYERELGRVKLEKGRGVMQLMRVSWWGAR